MQLKAKANLLVKENIYWERAKILEVTCAQIRHSLEIYFHD